MGLLDKISGKKSTPAKATADKASKPKAKKQEDVLNMVKEDSGKKTEAVVLKEDTGKAHRVLLSNHLSEKTNMLSASGTYVFKVAPETNKIEVKKAVEAVYDVHVVRVNILNNFGKNRKSGRMTGRTADWKKAIVTLKSGEKIAGLAEGV